MRPRRVALRLGVARAETWQLALGLEHHGEAWLWFRIRRAPDASPPTLIEAPYGHADVRVEGQQGSPAIPRLGAQSGLPARIYFRSRRRRARRRARRRRLYHLAEGLLSANIQDGYSRSSPLRFSIGAPLGPWICFFEATHSETAKLHHELVLVVSLAFSETPPRHAGHAVRPSQYAIAVPQYSVARFRRDGRAPRRELVLILSHAMPTLAQQLLLGRARRPRRPSTRRRGPVVFN